MSIVIFWTDWRGVRGFDGGAARTREKREGDVAARKAMGLRYMLGDWAIGSWGLCGDGNHGFLYTPRVCASGDTLCGADPPQDLVANMFSWWWEVNYPPSGSYSAMSMETVPKRPAYWGCTRLEDVQGAKDVYGDPTIPFHRVSQYQLI